MKNVYFLYLCINIQLKNGGGGGGVMGGGGGGGGWVLITEGGGGPGGKNCQNIDYVTCERPLSINSAVTHTHWPLKIVSKNPFSPTPYEQPTHNSEPGLKKMLDFKILSKNKVQDFQNRI